MGMSLQLPPLRDNMCHHVCDSGTGCGSCMQISMVDATLFENLEAVARHVRRSKAPFGGIQLILSGVAQHL